MRGAGAQARPRGAPFRGRHGCDAAHRRQAQLRLAVRGRRSSCGASALRPPARLLCARPTRARARAPHVRGRQHALPSSLHDDGSRRAGGWGVAQVFSFVRVRDLALRCWLIVKCAVYTYGSRRAASSAAGAEGAATASRQGKSFGVRSCAALALLRWPRLGLHLRLRDGAHEDRVQRMVSLALLERIAGRNRLRALRLRFGETALGRMTPRSISRGAGRTSSEPSWLKESAATEEGYLGSTTRRFLAAPSQMLTYPSHPPVANVPKPGWKAAHAAARGCEQDVARRRTSASRAHRAR
jgi:hypothetical protein